MKRRYLLLLPLLLSLAGCKEDFATLHFQESVSYTHLTLPTIYSV